MSSVYKGRIIEVTLEEVQLPDGRRFSLERVRHPGGAAVVAVDNQARVCLLRQYRHVTGGWLWELPAGKRDHGEPPLDTARRELAEEAGCRAGRWTELGHVWSSPGVFDEIVYLFLAQGLEPAPMAHEAQEQIEVHWLPFGDALRLAANGELSDAKSLAGLFRAWKQLEMEHSC